MAPGTTGSQEPVNVLKSSARGGADVGYPVPCSPGAWFDSRMLESELGTFTWDLVDIGDKSLLLSLGKVALCLLNAVVDSVGDGICRSRIGGPFRRGNCCCWCCRGTDIWRESREDTGDCSCNTLSPVSSDVLLCRCSPPLLRGFPSAACGLRVGGFSPSGLE